MGLFLDKYKLKEEEEEYSFLNKYKAQVGVGTKATGTLDISMPETEPISTPGVTNRMRGIGEAPKEYELESPLEKVIESKAFQDPKMIELHKINFESFQLTEKAFYFKIGWEKEKINKNKNNLIKKLETFHILLVLNYNN